VKKPPIKPANWLESVNCAIEGVLWATRSQRHLRWHFLAAMAVLVSAFLLRIHLFELILLTFAITLVLFSELVNTALEAVVDLVSPDFHPLAKQAKDVAAGAVLVASIGAVVVGFFTLGHHLFPGVDSVLGRLPETPGGIAALSVVLVVIVVVLAKARFNKGTPLHGGLPSGHSAVAFSIATSVALAGVHPAIAVLGIMLAGMVSHSRLLLGIHTLKEVVLGAVLGVVVTLVMNSLAWLVGYFEAGI